LSKELEQVHWKIIFSDRGLLTGIGP
jgi:hypothetical protein